MDLTPYSTIRPFFGPMDSWLGPEDAERIQSYALYEAIYKNVPDAFKLVKRGSDANPLYLPSARTLIEAKNRYLAKRWTYALDPAVGADSDRAALGLMLDNLFRREKIWSKFATQKRYGLIRGDSVWHVVGDAEKLPGKRLSVYEVDPGSYFPIYDEWNPEKIYGVHLVDQVLNAANKTVIKRQTYRKTDTGRISYELTWWETGAWDDRDPDNKLKPISGKDVPEGSDNAPVSFELDPRITSLPVYHIKNNITPNAPFGTSDLSGYESIIAGINQRISDQDLALTLEGLGLYWTNSGPPTDDDGNETTWGIGPGWVVEIDDGSEFGRVGGVNSVTPSLDHIGALKNSMHEAAGIPDVAVGKVDVQTVESGIALQFQMAPLLASNEEKELEILSVTDHLLYDLTTMWIPVYEGLDGEARALSIVDDPLPLNRKAVIDEIVVLLSSEPPLISAEYARTLLSEKLGYDFPDEMFATVVKEAAELAKVRNVDPFAARIEQELDEGGVS